MLLAADLLFVLVQVTQSFLRSWLSLPVNGIHLRVSVNVFICHSLLLFVCIF